MDRLTLEQLVAKKLERDTNEVKFKDIEVPSLGGTLLFEKPKDEDIFDAYKIMNSDEGNLEVTDEAYKKLIYRCCPTLRDPALQTQLGVQNPFDVAPVLLELKDRLAIGNELLIMSGLGKDGVTEDIKKQ